jgi:tetratricopeptide (TPR) repeat protein/transcriptional regulator with XRE-family HTH domain
MAEEVTGFGSLLRSCRVTTGLSQEDLVRRSGLDVRTIRNLERGRARWPYPDTVRRLADALDLRGSDRDAFTAAAGRRLAPATREAGGGAAAGPGPAALPSGESAPVIPRELPGGVRAFTGRVAEMAVLSGLLEHVGQVDQGTVVISAIGGTAGVGKTALAVHWARQVADRFPHGLLYANLRGYDPGQPLSPADALAGFLRSLGVPGQDIPPAADQRAARYRSLLAGKQMLILLDNARSAEQVRPLLPGTGSCLTLVTSRDALAGLVIGDGATRLDLHLLPPQDAISLLRTLIGPRVDAEPEAVAELAELCCRLPLALRVAAELAAIRPDASLATLSRELGDLHTRLDKLDVTGDPRTQVRAVFSWSCRHLDAETARTFRLVGLHPGPDLDPYAAAALTGATVPQARQALDVLVRAHLVQAVSPGRYGMHDLLRSYARELSATDDTDDTDDTEHGQHAALTRLFDYYLHTAAVAMHMLVPAERHHRPGVPPPATPVPALADSAMARGWLDKERATLMAAAVRAAACDWPDHATRLADTLAHYLLSGGHLTEARAIFDCSLDAARRINDRAAEASALRRTGDLDKAHGRLQQAGDRYRQARDLSRAAGDRTGEARATGNLGLIEANLGRFEQAVRYHQEALAIFRANGGDRLGEARALGGIGLILQRQGRYPEAADNHRQSLDLSRQIGDRLGETWALTRLGTVDLRRGRYHQGADYIKQALTLARDLGSASAEAEITGILGEAHRALGRYQQAIASFQQALDLARQLGSPGIEASVLNGLGETLSQTGEPTKARAYHVSALQVASRIGSPREQARAHSGLARAHETDGDRLQARHHWQEALTRYDAIGSPDANEIRARLAAAPVGGNNDDKPKPDKRTTKAPSSDRKNQ